MSYESKGAAPVRSRVGFSSWWMVSVLFALYVFSWLDRLIISMLVEPIKLDLALTDFQMSLLLGPAFAVFYALFGLPLGWAVDRWPRRWIVFFGVTVWGLATAACGLAQSFEGLLVARVMVGVGEACLIPAAYSLLADEFPRDRLTAAASTFQMGGKVGSAAAFGLGAVAITYAESLHARGISWSLLGDLEAWQRVMVMVGLPGVVLAALVFTFREPPRRGVAVANGGDEGLLRIFLRANWRLIGLMLVCFSALALCGYSLTSWVPTYLSRHFGWAPMQYGPALSVMNIASAVWLVVNGRIVDRLFGRGMKDAHMRFYSWLMYLLAPAVVLLFVVSDPWVFLGLYCLVQFITVPFMVYVSSIIALLAPNAIRGQLIAMFLFVFTTLGMGAGPALVGALTDFVFKDEARLGTSLMIVIVSCFAIALVAMRLSLRYLGPSILRAETAIADPGRQCRSPKIPKT
ncbi:MFS transporter [Luteimonas saliphila]|uniref:MFS transporter n=1 Tax=Luteimonas saliphila TaxID=2804919 RepID=UPI00192DFA08|nr:MFS transporter [Luteimonas saliphila]